MDLSTKYMGLTLKTPIVPSASPLSATVDNIKRMEDAGAPAVVMFSIFEEQLRQEAAFMDTAIYGHAECSPEALTYFPQTSDYHVGPDRYLDIIHRAKQSAKIPIIGSLNGVTNEGWIEYARRIQSAGADGLELNVYYIPTEMQMTSEMVEQRYLDIFKTVKAAVKIPVAIKLSPFFSSMANMARKLDQAGADALVMFNRFYQPDIDLEELEVVPHLNLSSAYEIRLPLMWIAILHGKIKASLGATRGVHSAHEVVKYLMAGADAVMTTSALLKHGIGFLSELNKQLVRWMEAHEYESVEQMKGSMSQRSVADPSAFERANYIRTLESYKRGYVSIDS